MERIRIREGMTEEDNGWNGRRGFGRGWEMRVRRRIRRMGEADKGEDGREGLGGG